MNNSKLISIKKTLLFTIAFVLTSVSLSAQEEPLFSTPFETTYNGTTLKMPYRIPALVETANAETGAKELIFFADKRHCGMDIGWGSSSSWNNTVTSSNDYFRIDIVSRRSTDGGQTWSSETTVKEGTDNCGYGDVAVTSNWENPKEIVFFAATGNVRYGNSTRSNPLKTTRFYSNDGGKNWTTSDMTTKMYDLLSSNYTGLFFTSGRICQSKKIKVGDYYRIYSALCVYNGSSSNAFVVYSDDFGSTWSLLGNKNSPAVSGGDESKVEELPNGNVLISSRISTSTNYDSNGRRRFNVFGYSSLPTSANTASGSWGTVYSGIQYTGKTKPCNGELLLVPAKDAKGNSCNILLHSEPYGTTEAEGRGNVSIFWKVLSSDNITSASEFEGTNWNRYEVSSTTSAYSTMILQHDGTIAFAYEETIWGSGYGAPSNSIDKITWGEHGYDLMYQNFTLETITKDYSYDARQTEEPVVETVATPSITPANGTFTGSAEVTISCGTDGAIIYYTTNGTTPSATNGTVYSAPFTLNEAGTYTIKAIAVKTDWNDSEVATATFTIAPENTGGETVKVKKYRFKNVQKGGNVYYFKYAGETEGLKLVTSESDATLYTRTVNSDGTYSYQDSKDGYYLIWSGRNLTNGLVGYNSGLGYSKEYDASYCNLTIDQMVAGNNVQSFSGTYYTVKGKRLDNGNNSDVYFVIKNGGTFDGASVPFYNSNYSSAFDIEEVEVEVEGGEVENETVATPVITPASGTFTGSAEVAISCATVGATIYYTTNGTTPTASNGTVYTAPFTLSEAGTYTVKAIAVKADCVDSEVVSALFTIEEENVEEVIVWDMSPIGCTEESCTDATYSTLYLDHAVVVPSGAKAYRAVLNETTAELTLYRIKSGIVPAGCAVIIIDSDKREQISFTKTETTSIMGDNSLRGTLVDIIGINPEDYYVLGHTQNLHIAFYHPNSTTLKANKAYLPRPEGISAIKMRFDDDTTAIDSIENDADKAPVYYDLMGRRVVNPTRGIYIVNGKKVLVR